MADGSNSSQNQGQTPEAGDLKKTTEPAMVEGAKEAGNVLAKPKLRRRRRPRKPKSAVAETLAEIKGQDEVAAGSVVAENVSAGGLPNPEVKRKRRRRRRRKPKLQPVPDGQNQPMPRETSGSVPQPAVEEQPSMEAQQPVEEPVPFVAEPPVVEAPPVEEQPVTEEPVKVEEPMEEHVADREDHAGSRYTYFASPHYQPDVNQQAEEKETEPVPVAKVESEKELEMQPVAEQLEEELRANQPEEEPIAEPLEEAEDKFHEEEMRPARKETEITEAVVVKEPKREVLKKESPAQEAPAAYKFAENLSKTARNVFSGVSGRVKGAGSAAGKFFEIFKLRYLVILLVLGGVGYGGYYIYDTGTIGKAYQYVTGFFTPKPAEKVEVNVNEGDLRSFGISTANLFAANEGSVYDRVPVQIAMADYFGELKEPKVQGETGISAATYYGDLKDLSKDINEFIKYVQNLASLQSLYSIDVYAMLDATTERDKALLKYLSDLKAARDQSTEIRRTIQLNIDDIATSYNSLTPDKTKYESDFFAAMDQLQAEKSDVLLKGFVDISQKQAALKARNGALSKLATYYDTALSKLDKRIEAVEQNKDALVQGIRVVDVPGGGVDVIIHPQVVK